MFNVAAQFGYTVSDVRSGGMSRWISGSPHRGMTLIELMVAMVIMSILASLSLAGLAVARTSARRSKTESTIRKLHEIILPYYEQYETRRPTITNSTQLAALPQGRTYLTAAKQTAIRRLMALELPERLSDVREAFTWPPGGVMVPVTFSLTYGGVTSVLADTPPAARRYASLTSGLSSVQSSELLHLIVTRGPVADPDVVAHFRDDEVRDTDGNGLPEFVDGWNRPIAFRRWPTGFASPMQPIDGSLRGIDTLVSANGHRLVPLIFSAGNDGSYDIEAMTSLSYRAINFDPFAINVAAPTSGSLGLAPQMPAIAGSVVLVGSSLSSGSVTGPIVFAATRLSAAGTIPPSAFQTVGSERDTGSAGDGTPNGIVESRDNITNHDMTR